MTKFAKKWRPEWDLMMKKTIYEATLAVVNERGFDGLRMDLVAKEAEVATGTLYNYFKNKDELMLHVMDTSFEPILEEFAEIVHSAASPVETLETFMGVYLNAVRDHKNLIMVLLSAEGLSPSIKEGANGNRKFVVDLLAELIAEGIESGHFRACNSMRTAVLIFGAITGLLQAIVESDAEIPPLEEDLSVCMSFCLNGLLQEK